LISCYFSEHFPLTSNSTKKRPFSLSLSRKNGLDASFSYLLYFLTNLHKFFNFKYGKN
ncbi:hypothetical protein HMPREF0023_0901, partial [Acinetobacter sp. ATCC 27244]